MSEEPGVPKYVLDSYAILVYLDNEPGAEIIEQILLMAGNGAASIKTNWVNIAEVSYILQRTVGRTSAQAAIGALQAWPLEPVAADEEVAFYAADLKAQFRISLADAFAGATAQRNKATIVTGDPEFAALESAGIATVLWLPEKSAAT